MEYEDDFEKSFMQRTLSLIIEYEGSLDATLLVNCLLGLMVLPKEAFIARLPVVNLESLAEWGIAPTSIKKVGRCSEGHQHTLTLKQLIRCLRNAVAHFRVKDPLHNLFFCFPYPIKSTSYKREFVGNWGYAEAP